MLEMLGIAEVRAAVAGLKGRFEGAADGHTALGNLYVEATTKPGTCEGFKVPPLREDDLLSFHTPTPVMCAIPDKRLIICSVENPRTFVCPDSYHEM